MPQFVRCLGKAYCIDGANGCRSCGRSNSEIETIRLLVAQAAQFVMEQDYDNTSEFTSYLAEKIEHKVKHACEQARLAGTD